MSGFFRFEICRHTAKIFFFCRIRSNETVSLLICENICYIENTEFILRFI